MRRILPGLVLMCACSPLCAADAKWDLKGMFGASFNSTSVSDNWSGNEKNSQSWGVKLDASAQRDDLLTNWVTTLKEEYGITRIGVDEQTSADLIDFNTVYTRKLSLYVNPYVGLIVNTQHWRVLDPVTYTESVGNGVWLLNRPDHQLRTRAGLAFRQLFDPARAVTDPATGIARQVSLADDAKTAAVEESRFSTGGEWITNYDVLFNENTKFVSEARVFSAFAGGASLRWDSSLFVKLSSLISLQINYLWVYNFDQAPPPVWPQDIEKRLMFVLGFSYNLF